MAISIVVNLGNVSSNITHVKLQTCVSDCDSCEDLVGYENVPVNNFPLVVGDIPDNINKIKLLTVNNIECNVLTQCLDINRPPTTEETTQSTTATPTTGETTATPTTGETTATPTTGETTQATTATPTTEETTLPEPTTSGTTAPPNVIITNQSSNSQFGQGNFTLEVVNEPFIGYVIGYIENGSVNTAQKLSSIQLDLPFATPESILLTPKITSNAPVGTVNTQSVAVNIPVGIYSAGDIQISTSASQHEDVYCSAHIEFSFTNVQGTGVTSFSVPYDRPGIPL